MEVAGVEQQVSVQAESLRQLLLEMRRMTREEEHAAKKTFGVLAAEWLARARSRYVCADNERRHLKHLEPLWALRDGELTKGTIDALFATLHKPVGPLAAVSVNKLRATGRLVVRDAQANGEWVGLNPFEHVDRLPEPTRKYTTLTVDEVLAVLPHIVPRRRRLSRVVLLMGMRPGEALGLKKVDVNLEARTVLIRRSHGRDQTKTGKEREVPIPRLVLGDLQEAMAENRTSPYVFPKPDGTRQRADTKLARMLQTAMAKAGLISGYRNVCRRKGCHFSRESARPEHVPCPECGFRLLPVPVPRAIRFYDLRHSAATLHRKAGADPLAIQMALGHAATNTTDAIYTHLDTDDVRRELNKLKLTKKREVTKRGRRA